MSNKQAGKLIIENIQMLEEAIALLEGELSEDFFAEVDKFVKHKIEEFEGEWRGEYAFLTESLSFAPENWQLQQMDTFKAKNTWAVYQLWNQPVSEDSSAELNWLCIFFSNPNQYAIFRFELKPANFVNRTQKALKAFTSNQNEIYPEIERLGFKFLPKESAWMLPIASLDQKQVAECYVEDNLADALTPIIDALDKLQQAHPYFEKIVAAAKDELGIKELE